MRIEVVKLSVVLITASAIALASLVGLLVISVSARRAYRHTFARLDAPGARL